MTINMLCKMTLIAGAISLSTVVVAQPIASTNGLHSFSGNPKISEVYVDKTTGTIEITGSGFLGWKDNQPTVMIGEQGMLDLAGMATDSSSIVEWQAPSSTLNCDTDECGWR